jgi:hypothetical protein
MEDIIKQITGKLFKDGPYEYQIYIKSGDLGLGAINSISIFVDNIPDHVGVDLIIYAMGRMIDVAGEELKSSEDEFMINKIIVERYPSLGEIVTAMGFTTELGLQSFTQLNATLLKNRNKKIDLKELKQKVSSRVTKLTKVMEYITNTFTSPIEGIETKVVSHNVAGILLKSNNTIVPALRLDVNITTDKGIIGDKKNEIIKAFKDQLREISPIEIHSYDILAINVFFKPDVVNGLTQIKA